MSASLASAERLHPGAAAGLMEATTSGLRGAADLSGNHVPDLLRATGGMAGVLAHELNQPLTVISLLSTMASRLAERTPEPGSVGRLPGLLAEITEQSQRAIDIIRSLKSMSGAGPKKDATDPVDVNEAVRSAARTVRFLAERAQVRIRLTLADELPRPHAERVQIEQVLINLMKNAIEAFDGVSRPERDVEIQTSWDGRNVVVSVRDTGKGVPEGHAERLFDRFYTTRTDGMGIGLAFCRSVIESCGGRLTLTSNPDCGATFTFTLPTRDGGVCS